MRLLALIGAVDSAHVETKIEHDKAAVSVPSLRQAGLSFVGLSRNSRVISIHLRLRVPTSAPYMPTCSIVDMARRISNPLRSIFFLRFLAASSPFHTPPRYPPSASDDTTTSDNQDLSLPI